MYNYKNKENFDSITLFECVSGTCVSVDICIKCNLIDMNKIFISWEKQRKLFFVWLLLKTYHV